MYIYIYFNFNVFLYSAASSLYDYSEHFVMYSMVFIIMKLKNNCLNIIHILSISDDLCFIILIRCKSICFI